jgi:hypothetical protein
VSGLEVALLCPFCNDTIGVYEPLVVFSGGAVHRTSLARDPRLRSGEELVLHLACAPGLEADSPASGDGRLSRIDVHGF